MQICVKVLIGILAIASVFLRLLPSQVDAYSSSRNRLVVAMFRLQFP